MRGGVSEKKVGLYDFLSVPLIFVGAGSLSFDQSFMRINGSNKNVVTVANV